MDGCTLTVLNMEIVPVTLSQAHLMSSSRSGVLVISVWTGVVWCGDVRYNETWSRSNNNNNKVRGVFNID